MGKRKIAFETLKGDSNVYLQHKFEGELAKIIFQYHKYLQNLPLQKKGEQCILFLSLISLISFCRIKFLCIDLAMCYQVHKMKTVYEPRSEKTGLQGFRPGPTQTGLYNHRRWLEH